MNHNIFKLESIETKWQFPNKSDNFCQLADYYRSQINQYLNTDEKPIVFLAEKDPKRFIAAFFASVISKTCLFLINPDWKIDEWQQIENIATPDLIFGDINYRFKPQKNTAVKRSHQEYPSQEYPRFTSIMIPTGGTSGKIKFAIHTWETLTASAKSFHLFFDSIPLNFYSCLPLYHVSGLMPVIRSFISQGKLIVASFQQLKNNLQITDDYQDYFISFVPTQLQFFLDKNPLLLTKFKTILVGGATIYPQQISLAKKYHIPLALTYGMTETASGITILKPEKLQQNNHSNGQILPHTSIFIKGKNQGIISIKSSSLFKGYYPQWHESKLFKTDDIGYLDDEQYLYVLGRNSQKIITGGENVFPLEVETAILATGLVKDIYVRGEKDNYWGEIITAFYVPTKDTIDLEAIKKKLSKKISKYKIPKQWYRVEQISRNQQGKITKYNNFK